jgi:hypothetical protein
MAKKPSKKEIKLMMDARAEHPDPPFDATTITGAELHIPDPPQTVTFHQPTRIHVYFERAGSGTVQPVDGSLPAGTMATGSYNPD